MRSLSDWMKYLEEQEQGVNEEVKDEQTPERTEQVVKPSPIKQQIQQSAKPKNVSPVSKISEKQPGSKPKRRLSKAQAKAHTDETAQNYYRPFKETREELLERLLDPMISLEEAARVLNVCPATVRRYTNRGVLKHIRTPGNQRRFRLSDVLAFMETIQGAKD